MMFKLMGHLQVQGALYLNNIPVKTLIIYRVYMSCKHEYKMTCTTKHDS